MKSWYFILILIAASISPITAAEVRIRAVAPEAVSLSGPFTIPGRVVPGERIGQRMTHPGRIIRMLVTAGMRIPAGTMIAEIESDTGRLYRIAARHAAVVSTVRAENTLLGKGDWIFLEREEGTYMVELPVPAGMENEFTPGSALTIELPTVIPTLIPSTVEAVHDGKAYSAISYSSRFLEYRTVKVQRVLKNREFFTVPVSSIIRPMGGKTFIWTVSSEFREPRRIAVYTYGMRNGSILVRGPVGPREYVVVTPLHLLGRQKNYQWTVLENRGGAQ